LSKLQNIIQKTLLYLKSKYMSETFDYIKNIGSLTLEQKRKFYVLFAHNLTVSVRAICFEESYSDQEKIVGMKQINEIMHRLIFRIEELHKISNLDEYSWTEKDFFQMITGYVSENQKVLAGNIGWAVKSSCEKCFTSD
jgi:hypothetical protein